MAGKSSGGKGGGSKNSHTVYRDNNTGQLVSKDYGKSHPKSTTKEQMPNPGRGDTGR